MQISPSFFPALDAVLNGSSAVLIGTGFYFIKRGRREAHKRTMLAAFATSTLFLICYLYYHLVLHGLTRFQGQGISRTFYFALLLSHTILAAVVVPFILITLARALKGSFARHKAIAPYTFAIWMYVSVTGVIIYLMLYKIFVR
jgi:uncharacterized membrane protein YozB (DUF420 family)